MAVSLLPQRKTKKADRSRGEALENKRPIFIGSVILFLFIALYAWSAWYAKALNDEAARVRARALETQRQSILTAEDEVRAFSTRLNGISFLLDNPTLTSNVLEFVERITHPKVQFTDFSFLTSTGAVSLRGITESYMTFGEQFLAFEQNEKVSDLRIENITLDKSGQVVFLVFFTLDSSVHH